MLSGAVARRYAKALLELAQAGNALDNTEGELKGVLDVLEANPEFKRTLFHPAIVVAEKISLVDQVFGKAVSNITLNFLRLIITRRREQYLDAIVGEFVRLANEARNMVDAEVASAVPLAESELANLKEKLARLTGKTVSIKPVVKPELIGGVVVKLGDQIIDGSVSGKLAKMSDRLKQVQ